MAPKKKILIVDDEPDMVAGLQAFLEDNGYETCCAYDGKQGMKVLEKEKPALITLDLKMPQDTGTRFYRNLSKNKEFKDVPVIIISGLAGRHLAAPHPFAVFDKPIDKENLLAKIKAALGDQ
jgi:DNA-binding response OmpR family regulator